MMQTLDISPKKVSGVKLYTFSFFLVKVFILPGVQYIHHILIRGQDNVFTTLEKNKL